MYEETVNGLRTIVNNFKGRLTPWMRVTIAEAANAIEELEKKVQTYEEFAPWYLRRASDK